jgi:hypothetical protein
VVTRVKDSAWAQPARHRIHLLRSTSFEQATMKSLDAQRQRLAARRDHSAGTGRVWLELGGQYEYLMTTRPRTLYLAAECYREGARDLSDSDTVQNCLLRAAAVYQTYLNRDLALNFYSECIRRFPGAPSVPRILKKMRSIYLERGDQRGLEVYVDFLRRYPSSPRAIEVQRLRDGR